MNGSALKVTAFDWVPAFAQGQVRDLRLRWALREAGFPYAVELVPQGAQAGPENLARQPFGQVPALLVDGVPMFESGACLWRIAEESDALLPEDCADRGRCLSWHFAALNTLEPPLSMLATLWFFEWHPEAFGIDDPAAARALRPAAEQGTDLRLAQLAQALGDRAHIVADRFTVADLTLTAVLLIAQRLEVLDRHPVARTYFDRHSARPAFRAAQAEQVATFTQNAPRYEGAA